MNIVEPLLILGILGLVFGLVLGYASKKFHVEVDPLIPQLREQLPGANCGGCGFTGCDAYAQALAEGTAKPGACPVGGAAVTEAVSAILGVEASSEARKAAYVHCCGTAEHCQPKYRYEGIQSCNEAAILSGGGFKSCAYGCLGYGSCVAACKFDAIHIENGIAVVNTDACVACGACINACPKHLIDLVTVQEVPTAKVDCSNKDRGKDVKAVCDTGCIGCSLCVRNCPNKAITMDGAIPKIDTSLCTGCGACAEKCPSKVIHLS